MITWLKDVRYFSKLRASFHMRGLFIGLVSVIVVLSLSAGVTYYHGKLGKYDNEIAFLRNSMEEMSAHQQNLMSRSKRSISRDGRRRVPRGVTDNVELVLARNGGNNSRIISAYGVAYTRWGRRDCQEKSEFLYRGYTAMTHYSHTGGGSNFMCLHWNISYSPGNYVNGGQGTSHVYGVEYSDSTWINNLFDVDGTEGASLHQHTVPCSVCIARSKVTQVMIPGRDVCPDQWQLEYSGFIMAGSHGDKHPSKFICVDRRPQVVPNTQGSQPGGHLHVVETQCPSLVCEPYIANRELPCVVCSV